MQERRQYNRWQINQEAQLKSEELPITIPCVIDDISMKGMRISSAKSLLPETLSRTSVPLSVTLSDGPEFKVGARIAWNERAEGANIYGLNFVQIEDPDKEAIYHYIKNNFPKEFRKYWWQGT
jgi:c-di-GMP-binding flagellar brake protein YcgR